MKTRLLILILLIIIIYGYKYPIKKYDFEFGSYHRFNTQAYYSLPYYVPTIRVCIGIPKQCLNLAIDTNCLYTFVSHQSDNPIFKQPLDINQSESIRVYGESRHFSFFFYNTFLYGNKISDVITMEPQNSPLGNVMMIVLASENIEVPAKYLYDGHLGLFHRYDDKFTQKSDFSFIDNLSIANRQFGIKLDREYNGEFYLDNEFDMKSIGNICIPDKKKLSQNWKCEISSIKISNTVIQVNRTAFFMSASQFITIPKAFSESITSKIINESNNLCYYKEDEAFYCSTEANITQLSPLEIIFDEGNGTLVIEWADLFELAKTDNGNEEYIAKILFLPNAYLIVELGLPVFINRIIVFNKDENKIAFLPFDYIDNNHRLYQKFKEIFIVVVIIMCIIGIALLGGVKYVGLKTNI